MAVTDDPLPDLVRSLRSPIADQRARSARSLGRLGWLARDALPLLVRALEDGDSGVREAAAQAVGQMGLEALSYMVGMLDHDDKYVRRNAVWAIGKLGSLAKSAIPYLCIALHDPDPRTASGAAQALGNIGADAAEAVPQLMEAMRGTNIVLCRLAAKALSQIGQPALQPLIAHLKHRDPFVRGEACLALGWMGPEAAAAVPALIELLRPARPSAWLVNTPPPSAVQTPTTPINNTCNVGSSTEDNCRIYAAQALGRIGHAAMVAMPLLHQVAKEPNDQIHQAAQQALRLLNTV